jgi:oligopeptide/dipeptide ABC transporter ATP-binding protein
VLPPPPGRVERGSIRFRGEDLLALPATAMRGIRGHRIAMIFQEPMTALNPVQRIGAQLREVLALHAPELDAATARQRALDMLARLGIPAPAQRLDEYPHQLSGGMRQRVMIAMALLLGPDILIADEPTTALDVTIQAQILELLRALQRDTGMSMLFITHDLGVVAGLCDHVVVMYAGRIAESAPTRALFATPRHPYTRGLLASIPRLDGTPKTRLTTIEGSVPAAGEMPPGCRYANRCAHATDICRRVPPPLAAPSPVGDGVSSAGADGARSTAGDGVPSAVAAASAAHLIACHHAATIA